MRKGGCWKCGKYGHALSCGQCRQCGLDFSCTEFEEEEEVMMAAEVSILPMWSDQDIRNLQKADTNLRAVNPVMEWLESGISAQQCSQNSTCQLKSLWTQRGNLDVKDGILYRQWEDILGGEKNKRLQLTLPGS